MAEMLENEQQRNALKANFSEILWHLINSFLAGALVFLGSLADGEFSVQGLIAALVASLIVAITKLKEYWDGEAGEYSKNAFSFVSL